MQLNKLVLPQDIYSAHLETVNNIKFTRREVDIIAYLFSGRSAKTISFLLSITPKTIESHMRNIMIKLERNSRDGIIDFIEKSDKFIFVKEHYLSLLAQASFERSLLKISELIHFQVPACLLIYWREKAYHPSIICSLEKHLKLAGINLLSEAKEGQSMYDPLFDLKHRQADYALYCFTEALLKQQNEREDTKKVVFFQGMQKISGNPNCILTLFLEKGNNGGSFKELDSIRYINFSDEGYYSFVFKVLKKLLSNINFDNIISEFREQCAVIYDSFEKASAQPSLSQKTLEKKSLLDHVKSYVSLPFLKRRKTSLFVGSALCLTIFFIVFLFFNENKKGEIIPYTQGQSDTPTRSDLIVPTGAIFLDRPHLTAKLDEFLKGPQDIKTVALVGIGGAGKTSLSRQYARLQKANLVWEINAETPESLSDSFENLADALSKTKEERKALHELRDIKDPKEREKAVFSLIREKLKSLSNWFLIYDNVEKFADIQRFFPHDADVWGKGKIVLTTRDLNIQNNKHINNTLQVAELNEKEKILLFNKIMSNDKIDQLTHIQKEEITKFLSEIPPFPLDVSIAAYYLKTTNIPYNKYLEHMKENDQYFSIVQGNVLNEATEYSKTRYNIITLSLNNIINESKDFRDLLLFISLLDSQNIPRNLLNAYKSDVIVENFVYNLKKYSLITIESSSSALGPVFSIHRSTQNISLNYLTEGLNLEKNSQPLQSIADSLDQYLSASMEEERLSELKFLITHCERFLSHNNILTDNIRKNINSELGWLYYHLRNDLKAKEFLEASLSKMNIHEEKNYKQISKNLVCLGNIYMELGNHESARNLLDNALLDYKGYFSSHTTDVARDLAFIGDVYGQIGDYKKSKDALEQSLLIYKKSPENQAGLARVLAFIGSVYLKLGEYKKSQDALEQSVAICQEDFPGVDMIVPWVLIYLGNTYRALGSYEKAINRLEEGLKVYKKDFSEDHSDVAWAMTYLGDVYVDAGNYEKAKEWLEKSLKTHITLFTEDNIRTAHVFSCLGGLYTHLGNIEEAKKLFEKSLVSYEKTYGKSHLETARILNGLGQAYLLDNNIKKAENTLQKALKIFQEHNHPERYISLESLADLYLKESEKDEKSKNVKKSQYLKEKTINYLIQAKETLQNHFPMNVPQMIRIQSKLDYTNKTDGKAQ